MIEGMGLLFGSLVELLPAEQVTLAGIERLWAGLFAACGFALMMVGSSWAGALRGRERGLGGRSAPRNPRHRVAIL